MSHLLIKMLTGRLNPSLCPFVVVVELEPYREKTSLGSEKESACLHCEDAWIINAWGVQLQNKLHPLGDSYGLVQTHF